jgi:capsular polysaccharide biosynthesis protein
LAAGVAGYAVGAGGQPTYEAKAVLLVGPINTDFQTVRASGQLAQTYAQLATSRPVLDATAKRLGLSDVGGGVSASAIAVTRLLTVTVKDTDKDRAVRIAGAHASELVTLGEQRQGAGSASGTSTTPGATTTTPAPGISTSAGPGELQVVEPAQAASAPVGLGTVPIALAAALVGFLGALGLAVVLDRSSGTVRDAGDVAAATGAGAIASLGKRALLAGPGSVLVEREPRSRAAHDFRSLAAKLRAVGERSLCVLEVDDRAVGVSANLAAALTAGGRQVALVDAGEDKASKIPLRLKDGVTVHHVDGDSSAAETVERLLGEVDVVVVRAPGLDRSPAGLSWARVVDGTIIVASTDHTSRGDLTSTVEGLRLVHARLLGTVLGSGSGIFGRR